MDAPPGRVGADRARRGGARSDPRRLDPIEQLAGGRVRSRSIVRTRTWSVGHPTERARVRARRRGSGRSRRARTGASRRRGRGPRSGPTRTPGRRRDRRRGAATAGRPRPPGRAPPARRRRPEPGGTRPTGGRVMRSVWHVGRSADRATTRHRGCGADQATPARPADRDRLATVRAGAGRPGPRTRPCEQGLELVGRQRAGVQVALAARAAEPAQDGGLGLALDALGHDLEVEGPSELDDRAREDRPVARARRCRR